ncbi:MAG: hypothetical protein AB8I08_13370 [Sandaracinaceae bacterium]
MTEPSPIRGRALLLGHSLGVLSKQLGGLPFCAASPVLRELADEHDAEDGPPEEDHRHDEVDVQCAHPPVLSASMRSRKPCVHAIWGLLGIGLWLCAAPSSAAVPERADVTARIDRDAGRVRGELVVRVHVREGEDHVRLWLYGDRLAETPSRMDERSARWIYPGEIDHGGMRVDSLRVDGEPAETRTESHPVGEARGRDAAGSDVVVSLPPGPERDVVVSLSFALDVPGRFGRMGRDDGVLSLLAPWYPVVVQDDAWAFDVPTHLDVEADGASIVSPAGVRRDRLSLALRTPYLPLLLAPQMHQARTSAAGVEILLRAPHALYQPPPPGRRGDDGLPDLTRVDVVSRVREVAEEVFETARALGVTLPSRITMVEMPSRTELTAAAPGLLLYSDHLFQIFPIDQTLDFHRRALRRALFATLLEAAGSPEPPADRGWAADLRAVAMIDLGAARRRSGAQTPAQLLELFAFHPAVDQLLYAPQIAFEDAYFAAIEERDAFRDDPVRSRRPLSRGRRILEMARDALSPEAFEAWVQALMERGGSARDALSVAGGPMAARLDRWLAATGEPVNYRLGERSSTPHEGRYRHRVVVHRDGADRIEPVEVRLEDEAGESEVLRWEADGAEGVLEWTSDAPLSGVTLDPRHRLPQSPEIADGHPRVDDATDHPWRPPILNGFLFNALVSEQDFTGLLDFALRRRYDLEHTIGLRLQRTRATTGGTLRYSQGIGPKAHTNRRIASITGSASFDRLHAFFGDGDLGGWRAQGTVSASLNTVRFSLDPRQGYWGAVSLTGGATFRDDGSVGGALRGGLRAGMIQPLGLVNAIAVVIGGGFTAGDALLSELQGMGGSQRLRGFEAGEFLGRGALYGVVEHRWTAIRDMALNLAHLVWVREIQLAFFAGAGAAFDTVEGEDIVGAADVGAGVRVHFEYGGVQPGVTTIDVGLPLTRQTDGVFVDGELVRRRLPVGFYIGFDQYY